LPEATAIALGVRGVGFFRRATASATRTLLSMSSEPQDLDWPGSTTESNLSVAVVDFLAIAVRLERIPYALQLNTNRFAPAHRDYLTIMASIEQLSWPGLAV
jgi:hypothetical protein